MFTQCTSLQTITFGPNCTFENATEMKNMFNNCRELIELDLSSFRTSNTTKMYQMFAGCDKLIDLN